MLNNSSKLGWLKHQAVTISYANVMDVGKWSTFYLLSLRDIGLVQAARPRIHRFESPTRSADENVEDRVYLLTKSWNLVAGFYGVDEHKPQ